VNREERRRLQRAVHGGGQRPRVQPAGTVARRTDMLSVNDVVAGTGASGAYEDGPRTLAALDPAPEHAVRMMAYWLTWSDGRRQVYYGDTVVWVRT
jgi:hypothetical protein